MFNRSSIYIINKVGNGLEAARWASGRPDYRSDFGLGSNRIRSSLGLDIESILFSGRAWAYH